MLATIALLPILGAIFLAVFGINYGWLVGASPGAAMVGVLVVFAVLFGRTALGRA